MPRRLLLAAALAWGLAGSAHAELPEPQRHGPACTPAGCEGASRSTASLLAGFGLATLAIARATRRPRP